MASVHRLEFEKFRFLSNSHPQNGNLHLDLDLDNSRQEPEAITATSGCALQKSGEPTREGRYCVGLSN